MMQHKMEKKIIVWIGFEIKWNEIKPGKMYYIVIHQIYIEPLHK